MFRKHSVFITKWPALHFLLISIISHFLTAELYFHTQDKTQKPDPRAHYTSRSLLKISLPIFVWGNASVQCAGSSCRCSKMSASHRKQFNNSMFPFFENAVLFVLPGTPSQSRDMSPTFSPPVIWAWSQQGFPCRGVGDGPYFVWPGTSLSFSHRGPNWEYYKISLPLTVRHTRSSTRRGGNAERTRKSRL